jgi:hypothetical protein
MGFSTYRGRLRMPDDGRHFRGDSIPFFLVGGSFVVEAVDSYGQNGNEGDDDDNLAQRESARVSNPLKSALANDLQIF